MQRILDASLQSQVTNLESDTMEQPGDSLPLVTTRRARNGLKYRIEAVTDHRTVISIPAENKAIVVERPMHDVTQSWFVWEYYNEPVQDAFPYLNASEREFLISGSTDEEWDEMFGEEKANEGRTD